MSVTEKKNHLTQMQTTIQISLLAISSMIAERAIERYLSNSTTIITNHKINSDTTTFQTTTWRYSDTPNSYLFDFASLLNSISLDHLVIMVKTSLPPHVLIRDIKLLRDTEALVELVLENPDENNAKSCMLHNQTRSVLEHKGLDIKALDVWGQTYVDIGRIRAGNLLANANLRVLSYYHRRLATEKKETGVQHCWSN